MLNPTVLTEYSALDVRGPFGAPGRVGNRSSDENDFGMVRRFQEEKVNAQPLGRQNMIFLNWESPTTDNLRLRQVAQPNHNQPT